MTHFNSAQTLTQAACLLLAIGCTSRIDVANEGTGGAPAATGGKTSAIGGTGPLGTTSGGTSVGSNSVIFDTGGTSVGGHSVNPDTGGTSVGGHTVNPDTGFGGIIDATGGAVWQQTGGAVWQQTGGAVWQQTGGVPWMATGGTMATGGARSTSITGICTPGADQTCNDDVKMSALAGHCEADGSCTCGTGYETKMTSGKCTTHDQIVCYSPTQNIDQAYVLRAFGCNCDSTTSPPYCGIDSQGLRVYLACDSGAWQSDSTYYCNGSDPASCYSPSKNVNNALAANAIGCSCASTASPVCIEGYLDAGPDAGAGAPFTMRCVNGRWQTSNGCS